MQCSCSNCVFTIFKKLTIINILIRIKTESVYFFIFFTVYSATESEMTYSEFVLYI